jgi:hypothetical protein
MIDAQLPRIPLELHPLIIENLQPKPHFDGEETKLAIANLAICALVCTTWRSIAQPLIYYSIKIPYYYNDRKFARMLDHFTEHCHLSSFVKEIAIDRLSSYGSYSQTVSRGVQITPQRQQPHCRQSVFSQCAGRGHQD